MNNKNYKGLNRCKPIAGSLEQNIALLRPFASVPSLDGIGNMKSHNIHYCKL